MEDFEEEEFFAEDDEIDINEGKGGEALITKTKAEEKKEEENNATYNDDEIDPLDAFMYEINKVIEEQKKADEKKKKNDDKCEHLNKLETEKSDDESSLDDNDATADVYEFIEKKKEELEMQGIKSENENEEEQSELNIFFDDEKDANDDEIVDSIDYSTIQLDTFQKNIFVTDEKTMDFTLEQSVEYKKKNNIIATGFNIPKPLFSFLQIKNLINEDILQSWYDQSFHNLSPIQSIIIPSFLSGRDFIATSRTGSGKTLSFIISLTIHLLNFKAKLLENEIPENMESKGNHRKEVEHGSSKSGKFELEKEYEKGKLKELNILEEEIKNFPHAVILTPTKELCFQIYENMNKISLNQIKSCILFRGLNYHKICKQIKKGIDVVICGTKILIHFINKKVISIQNIKYFILDEFDKLFEKQNFISVISILKNARPDSIKVLYTSTVTDMMIERVKPLLNKKFITIKIEDKNNLITQNFIITQENQKYNALSKHLLMIKQKGLGNSQGIIFCNSKKNVVYLYEKLKKDKSLNTIVFDYMHGDVDQTDRITKFKKFKNKKIQIMVSSDLMSRGIDVVDINFIINYDCPNSIFNYVHRIGRCSRTNNEGDALTFITLADKKGAYNIYNYLKERKETIDKELENFIQSIENVDTHTNSTNKKTGKLNKKNTTEFTNNEMQASIPKMFKSFNGRIPILNYVPFKKKTTPDNHDLILKNLNVINPDDVLTSSDDD